MVKPQEIAMAARAAIKAGIVAPAHPLHFPRVVAALRKWDRTPAAGLVGIAGTYGDETYIVDDLGSLTFGQVDRRTNALARALGAEGVKPGDGVGLMCRNSRYFVESLLACSKLGATLLLLNTDFAAPQIAGVVEREEVVAIIADEEFDALLPPVERRYRGWNEGGEGPATIEELVAGSSATALDPPPEPGRMTILSSGTTGMPKGVRREGSAPIIPILSFLDRVPLHSRDTHFVVAPMFHGWGGLHLGLSLLLATTVVMRRRFDPEATLAGIAEHRVRSASMVPVMLQRVLELPDEVRARYDTSSLRAIPLGGSALPGELAIRAMDEFGDVVYNSYGSTEVALASTATPADLRAAPSTAGRTLGGVVVRILDERGGELPTGQTGRIFVGSELRSEGYTGGGAKEEVDGLLSSGDVGHFDAAGRLFVDGRDDDMIVSGGENVFPLEVEDLLSDHEAIVEAAIIGVEDEQFGQRLRAFVVTEDGATLDEGAVKDHVKANLARFKIPRDVVFLDELPRNPTGKVLKRELAEIEVAS